MIEEIVNKPGGTATVNAITPTESGCRYELLTPEGERGAIESAECLVDVEVGDVFDYEGSFPQPDRVSVGGQVLWESPHKA